MKRRPSLGLGLAMSLVFWAAGARATAPSVTLAEPWRGVYQIEGIFQVPSSSDSVWKVLTDYDRIGEFVSSIDSSKVKERHPEYVLIEQVSRNGVWFIHRHFEVLLKVQEDAGQAIAFEDVGGKSFGSYRGYWLIEPRNAGTRVTYRLQVEYKPGIPSFISSRLIRRSVARLLQEIAQEISRVEK